MDKRFTIFMLLAVVIIVANQVIYSLFFPPAPLPKKPVQSAPIAQAEPAGAKPVVVPEKIAAELEKPQIEQPRQPAAANEADALRIAPRRVAIGSGDPSSPFRMLVTFNNRGAAIECLELNSPRYRDLENRSGYLGYLAPTDAPRKAGAVVQIVGPGTPAQKAGLQVGDIITSIDKEQIGTAADLFRVLGGTKPDQKVELNFERQGNQQSSAAQLEWQPLAVIRPEWKSKPVESPDDGPTDPLSFLMTLQQFDERTLEGDGELGGVELRDSPWEIAAANQDEVRFRRVLPKLGLELIKSYHLKQVPAALHEDRDFPAYNLQLEISIRNLAEGAHRVAYRLDGPTGLPIEGAWYAVKVSRNWGGAGLRDVIARFDGGKPEQISPSQLADAEFAKKKNWTKSPLDYIAVDAQFFSVALIPEKEKPTDVLFAEIKPTRVGALPELKPRVNLTDVSFRLDSMTAVLEPAGPPLVHRFQIFAGPKRPDLLANYDTNGATLNDLVYYGWFWWVARPMLAILHVFKAIVGNYGLAIIMLTVLVRSSMFPVSRKQALSAQKMAELQPEIKRLNEKFKNEPDKKTKAQQELFRQHNYNPLGGCLLAFIQIPVFAGLYRSLQVDVELRQAPLFSEAIRWASNLAAPDMFWNWTSVMPDFITNGTGILFLGPYLNILPLIAVGLILAQQKMFMPPPADEQAALQQKMMQYMMVFMAFVFFRVPSGVCVYTIASSIWGLAERKLLPKPVGKKGGDNSSVVAVTSGATSGNGAAERKQRQRGRK